MILVGLDIFSVSSHSFADGSSNGPHLLSSCLFLEGYLFYDYEYVASVCVRARIYVRVCSTHLPGAHRGQKRASDALQLEFQMNISHCSSTYSLGPQLTRDLVLIVNA